MSLRKHKKHGRPVSAYKTCKRCGEEFPKDKDHFYPLLTHDQDTQKRILGGLPYAFLAKIKEPINIKIKS